MRDGGCRLRFVQKSVGAQSYEYKRQSTELDQGKKAQFSEERVRSVRFIVSQVNHFLVVDKKCPQSAPSSESYARQGSC